MRVCAFGTVRMDIRAYQSINNIEMYEEIKIDDMAFTVGGSVCNTVSVLNVLNQDVTLYMLNANDDFADFVKLKLDKRGLNCISCKQDQNNTAASLIFVDKSGEKKVISYDGVRQDRFILSKLLRDVNQYDLFYTSFYEINSENCEEIIKIMSSSKKNFIDLSPLIYQVDSEVIKDVLRKTDIVSGTEDEFKILSKKLNIGTYKNYFAEYGFELLLVKQGGRGATLYDTVNTYSYAPSTVKASRDTTGCGDTFNAGIIVSISKGLDKKSMLEQAVEMATSVAYNGFDLRLFRA